MVLGCVATLCWLVYGDHVQLSVWAGSMARCESSIAAEIVPCAVE